MEILLDLLLELADFFWEHRWCKIVVVAVLLGVLAVVAWTLWL
jgi:hypothetical protein